MKIGRIAKKAVASINSSFSNRSDIFLQKYSVMMHRHDTHLYSLQSLQTLAISQKVDDYNRLIMLEKWLRLNNYFYTYIHTYISSHYNPSVRITA